MANYGQTLQAGEEHWRVAEHFKIPQGSSTISELLRSIEDICSNRNRAAEVHTSTTGKTDLHALLG